MSAIERKYAARSANTSKYSGDQNASLKIASSLNSQELSSLVKKLTPPSSPKAVSFRPIHPDLVVLVFSLLAPLFIYQIFLNQSPILPWIFLILAGFYTFFFLMRKSLVAKYKSQIQSKKSAEERVQKGINRWMQLYYCARDEVIFNGQMNTAISVDLINGYLLQD